MTYYAEIDYDAFRRNEEQCKNCDARFRCWTERTLSLPIEKLSIEGTINADTFYVYAKVPTCFECGNMCGSNIKITGCLDTFVRYEVIGVITSLLITADSKQMGLEVRGILNWK